MSMFEIKLLKLINETLKYGATSSEMDLIVDIIDLMSGKSDNE